MRRLLLIAMALVFTALIAGATLAVVSSDEYIARSLCMRIHKGVSTDEVARIMAEHERLTPEWDDWFLKGGFLLRVMYDSYDEKGRPDLNASVVCVSLIRIRPKTPLDEMLEFLGSPVAEVHFFDCGVQ